MSAVATAGKTIRSTVPARLDRLGWSPFHTRMVAGLGAAWILDGLQITISSSVTGELQKPSTLGMTSSQIGLIASIYLLGEVVGALVFGKMSDRLGRKRLLITTLLLYLVGTGLAAFVTGHHTGWLVFFYLDALHRRDGDRRPVRGDQLGDRRDDAVEVPRPGRHLDQRQLLGRRDPRLVRLPDLPERVRGERRLAARVPDGPRARAGRDLRRAHAAREPALADDPRPRRGGRAGAREDRGSRDQVRADAGAGRRRPGDRAEAADPVRLRALPRPGLPHLPEAGDPRRHADDHPVVPLQRDLLHLRARADPVLRRQRDQGADLRARLLDRQPDRPARARRRCSTASAARR